MAPSRPSQVRGLTRDGLVARPGYAQLPRLAPKAPRERPEKGRIRLLFGTHAPGRSWRKRGCHPPLVRRPAAHCLRGRAFEPGHPAPRNGPTPMSAGGTLPRQEVPTQRCPPRNARPQNPARTKNHAMGAASLLRPSGNPRGFPRSIASGRCRSGEAGCSREPALERAGQRSAGRAGWSRRGSSRLRRWGARAPPPSG